MSDLLRLWQTQEEAGACGWEKADTAGGIYSGTLPWDYKKWLKEFLKKDTRLLDMDTGGGEFLLGLGHPPVLTAVSEGRFAAWTLCQKRLEPMGVYVTQPGDGGLLPFEDGSFDLVINRHAPYNLGEVRRVLKMGGHFVTQQMGGECGVLLARRLNLDPQNSRFNLENQCLAFLQGGFRVVRRAQHYPAGYFTQMGALCCYASGRPRLFPGFSVQRCREELLELQQELEERGEIPLGEHYFILAAKKIP